MSWPVLSLKVLVVIVMVRLGVAFLVVAKSWVCCLSGARVGQRTSKSFVYVEERQQQLGNDDLGESKGQARGRLQINDRLTPGKQSGWWIWERR
jgi:hypothetical protein